MRIGFGDRGVEFEDRGMGIECCPEIEGIFSALVVKVRELGTSVPGLALRKENSSRCISDDIRAFCGSSSSAQQGFLALQKTADSTP